MSALSRIILTSISRELHMFVEGSKFISRLNKVYDKHPFQRRLNRISNYRGF
jgi:hypothetical protein